MSLERTITHIATRETQVRADLGRAHATVFEAGRLLSRVVGSDPTRAKKLIMDLEWAVTDVGDLKAEGIQLTHARSTMKINGSARGISVVPAGKRAMINLRPEPGASRINDPLVVPRSLTGK
jgi:hypothetical protein